MDVYTPDGSIIYRNFGPKGESKPTPLKPPKVTGHAALMRNFRDCIMGKATPIIGPREPCWPMIMRGSDCASATERGGPSRGSASGYHEKSWSAPAWLAATTRTSTHSTRARARPRPGSPWPSWT